MNVIEALEAMEAAARGNDRLAVLKKYDSWELKKVLNLAMSPDITFGVKKIPAPDLKQRQGQHLESDWYGGLDELTNTLANRWLTGNAARQGISEFLGWCTDPERKWTERILRQDLRLDVGAKDVNNTLGEDTIKIFEVPLATAVFDSKRKPKLKVKDLLGWWRRQAKIDGGRSVAELPAHGGYVRLRSRSGKLWRNFESIRAQLQRWNKERNGDETLYIDGEVASIVDGRIDFNAIQRTMHREDGVEIGRLELFTFDAATEEEWYSPSRDYDDRLASAVRLVDAIKSDRIKVMPDFGLIEAPTFDELLKMGEDFVEMGYEGVILRRPDEPVELKRGKKLLKVKLFEDAEAVIIGTNPGAPHTKNENTLGALVCQMKDGTVVEVGGGFNPDSYRDTLWAMRETLPGQICTLAYFGLSKDGVPRHPQFRGIRHPDDIS